jgi:hypothetical protein
MSVEIRKNIDDTLEELAKLLHSIDKELQDAAKKEQGAMSNILKLPTGQRVLYGYKRRTGQRETYCWFYPSTYTIRK